jgi:hypothetical protein
MVVPEFDSGLPEFVDVRHIGVQELSHVRNLVGKHAGIAEFVHEYEQNVGLRSGDGTALSGRFVKSGQQSAANRSRRFKKISAFHLISFF